MKKVLAVSLAIMMVVALAACGSSGQSSGSASGAVSDASASASASVASQSAWVSSEQDVGSKTVTFGVSNEAFIDALSKNFEGFPTDPQTQTGTNDNGTQYTQYVYTIDGCISVQSFETIDKELFSVIILANNANMTTTQQAKDLGSIEAIVVALFETDSATLEKVDSDLNIVNSGFTDGTMNFATGTYASYMYFVNGTLATLTVRPK